MTESQRKSLALSEARSALNNQIERRNKLPADQEPSADDVSAMDAATRKVSALEVEYRAALVTEQEAEEKRAADDPDGAELEKRRILARANVLPFILEAMDGDPLQGAEKELRSAVFGDEAEGRRLMPVDLLLQPETLETRAQGGGALEKRADAVTPVDAAALADGSQASVLERVFTRSVAARLGVAMPSVPVGAAVYPIMTGGTTASMAGDGTRVDAAAGSFTGHTLEPIRLTAGYLFNIRQMYQLRNFEQVLRRDLSAVMSDAMDNQIINGDGSDPNVNGFISELPSVTNPTAVTNHANYLSTFTGKVDGLNAYNLTDLRSVVGASSFQHMQGTYRNNQTDLPVYEELTARVGGLSVSSRIPAPASNIQTNIMALTSYPGRNAVAPVWRGMEVIRDPYSNAAEGQVRLTAIMFFNFKILRETGWSLWKTKVA